MSVYIKLSFICSYTLLLDAVTCYFGPDICTYSLILSVRLYIQKQREGDMERKILVCNTHNHRKAAYDSAYRVLCAKQNS